MKVPKGTSDYQATWIVDEDEDENGDMAEESSEDDDDDDMLDEAMEGEDEDNDSQVHTESSYDLLPPAGPNMTKGNLITDRVPPHAAHL